MSNSTVVANATQTIEAGSQSFASAARLFEKETRESAVMLYAWCRHCDDVVDGQKLGHGQAQGDRSDGLARLAELETWTQKACRFGMPDDLVFAGLAEVVRRHHIPDHYPMEHLAGFRMDVEHRQFDTIDDTLEYCWRVAGVVGVMMSMVMGQRDSHALDRACDLGIAFQLTNIARDIIEDASIGRVYLPSQWLAAEGMVGADDILDPKNRAALARVAARLVDLADPYYASAVAGIGMLPMRSAWSIATARGVYRAIGWKVQALGTHAWDCRAATGRGQKLWCVARGAAVAVGAHCLPATLRPRHLYQRPV